jgi:hypothetical protein
MPKRVIIERHSHKTKHVIESVYGPINIEIETMTIMTTMVGDDEDEGGAYCPFEEELLAASPRRISRRPK